jgi:hypothetical protein
MGLGILVRFIGVSILLGLFLYGVYSLFARSVLLGLLMIGAYAMVSWILSIGTGLFIVAGTGEKASDDAATT